MRIELVISILAAIFGLFGQRVKSKYINDIIVISVIILSCAYIKEIDEKLMLIVWFVFKLRNYQVKE